MRVIKNTLINEYIVKCPECGSIFAYERRDLDEGICGISKLRCPCCFEEDAVFNYIDVEETNEQKA